MKGGKGLPSFKCPSHFSWKRGSLQPWGSKVAAFLCLCTFVIGGAITDESSDFQCLEDRAHPGPATCVLVAAETHAGGWVWGMG